MKVGLVVAQGFDMHLPEVVANLMSHHQVDVFHPLHWPWRVARERIDRVIFDWQLETFARKCDVVFCEWAEQEFVRASHLLRDSTIVVRLHSHELWDFAPRAHWPAVRRVILVSQAMERKLLERYPELKGRTSVVHNGVRLDRFRHTPRSFHGVVGTLCRIDPHKRLYDLVLCMYELRRQGIDWKLRIGGNSTEERYQRYDSELTLLVRRLGLSEHVEFTGRVVDVPSWLADIDVFVSHSCTEGLQVALIEAMASGVYCLSHRWDGAEEVLPADNLYWTDLELQNALQAYWNALNEDRRAKSAAMRARAEASFNSAVQVEQIRLLVEDAANSSSHSQVESL